MLKIVNKVIKRFEKEDKYKVYILDVVKLIGN